MIQLIWKRLQLVNGKIVYTGDISGKQVYSSTITESGINTVDASILQNGMYLLQAGNEKFKLMIVK